MPADADASPRLPSPIGPERPRADYEALLERLRQEPRPPPDLIQEQLLVAIIELLLDLRDRQ